MGSPASHVCRHRRRGGRLPMESMAALPWNQRQASHGIGGRLAMESLAAFVWNGWQPCRGITGRLQLASLAALPWNTQTGYKICKLRCTKVMKAAWQAEELWCGKFDEIQWRFVVRNNQIALRRWPPPQRVTAKF